ncbi:MAG: hypothetical protein IKW17_04965 [Paludibacteraceae bacterium]|nr:hypothetical protein [Paludibacteraceae bacterium]
MEEFRFIPNDVIYVEATSVDLSKSIEDIDVDFYRNIFKFGEKRFVYLPEVVRYFMPNIEFDKQSLFDVVIRLSGLDITGSGFIVVEEDGMLSFWDFDDIYDNHAKSQFCLKKLDFRSISKGSGVSYSYKLSLADKGVIEDDFCLSESLIDDSEDVSFDSIQFRVCKSKLTDITCLGMGLIASPEHDEEIEELTAQVTTAIERLKKLGVDYVAILNIVKGEPKLSRIVVDDRYRIFLSDYQNMEIEMRPTAKALYLLYLKYADGIAFKDLPDYKDELMKIYAKVTSLSNEDAQREAVEALVDPFQNTINVTCSRVKEAFVSRFNNDLADYYVISGKRGDAKKIKLNRGLVELKCMW